MSTIAIVFLGLPGCGKSTIALELEKHLNTVLIEQDHFYKGKRADHDGYLKHIKKICTESKGEIERERKTKKRKLDNKSKRVLLLCKNHHIKKHLEEVLDILNEESVRYYLINLVPDTITEEHISKLLERIEHRNTYSHLVIDSSSSQKRARCVLMKGFIEKYEKPSHPYLSLSFMSPLSENIDKILKYISI